MTHGLSAKMCTPSELQNLRRNLILLLLTFPARLWTVSRSSEHLEGMPSRLNPSTFAPSPTSSPNRILRLEPYQGQVPSQVPSQFSSQIPHSVSRQGHSQPVAADPYIAGGDTLGYTGRGTEHQPHLAWSGMQTAHSPFANRDAWLTDPRDNKQHPTLPNSRETLPPKQHLDLIPETSERLSVGQSSSHKLGMQSSNMPEMSSKSWTPVALNDAEPKGDKQTNGASHTPGWTHHSSIMQAYQSEA